MYKRVTLKRGISRDKATFFVATDRFVFPLCIEVFKEDYLYIDRPYEVQIKFLWFCLRIVQGERE